MQLIMPFWCFMSFCVTSRFKYIVNHSQKSNSVKCVFYGIWALMRNLKGALWKCTQNFKPIHYKICILRGVKCFANYDILDVWQLRYDWDGRPLCSINVWILLPNNMVPYHLSNCVIVIVDAETTNNDKCKTLDYKAQEWVSSIRFVIGFQ